MSYGSGLGAGGARSIAQPMPAPSHDRVTRAAPTAAARAGLIPREPSKLYGSIPIESVEGHEPDPHYDVRPIEGLGAPPVRSEMLGFLRLDEEQRMGAGRLSSSRIRTATATATPNASEDDRNAIAGAGSFLGELAPSSASFLPLLLLGAGLLFLVKR